MIHIVIHLRIMIGSYRKFMQYGVVCVLISLCLLSCGDPVGGPGKSPIFLSVRSADEYGIACDVYDPTVQGNATWDTTHVIIKSIYRDQSDNMSQTVFADVILEEQRVQYFRYDNDPRVPEPFIITLPNSDVPENGDLDLEIIVVRADAKLKSPLKELAFGGGEGEIYLSAQVEFYGRDLMGNRVYGSIVIPIWARDY